MFALFIGLALAFSTFHTGVAFGDKDRGKEARKRWEEKQREARKRAEEQEREARKHWEEQQREARKHAKELEREARKDREALESETLERSLTTREEMPTSFVDTSTTKSEKEYVSQPPSPQTEEDESEVFGPKEH
jgi:hypothetical protein